MEEIFIILSCNIYKHIILNHPVQICFNNSKDRLRALIQNSAKNLQNMWRPVHIPQFLLKYYL